MYSVDLLFALYTTVRQDCAYCAGAYGMQYSLSYIMYVLCAVSHVLYPPPSVGEAARSQDISFGFAIPRFMYGEWDVPCADPTTRMQDCRNAAVPGDRGSRKSESNLPSTLSPL